MPLFALTRYLPRLLLLAALAHAAPAAAANAAAPSFAVFVDAYLERFSAFHPSIAAGNGIHGHDGDLEDFGKASISREVQWLTATRQALDAFDPARLTPDERIDRRILSGIIDGWLLDLSTVQTYRRNPMVYVAALSDGLHDLATMESAPAEVRMRAALTKLRHVPRLLAQARRNVRNPPKVFVTHAIAMLDGVSDLLTSDLPLAFRGKADPALAQRLEQAAAVASREVLGYRNYLKTEGLATASDRFAIGTAAVEARYRAEELIDLPADRLLAIGERELARAQVVFTQTAARIDPARDPVGVWQDVQRWHPARGELVPAARALVDELFAFVAKQGLVDLPANERVVVAPAPAYDLGMASMHSSPPLEPHPVKSYYYVTDADAGWPAERQDAWLSAFNYATLADITAHEVVPGHYVHSLFMRRTPGKIRRIWVGLNPFPQPSSGQDGWAHYAEQLVADEGFHADDPRYRLAQTGEALNRICRLIAGLRLHSGAWTIADAAAFFEREAHLPAVAARREAERGTYDPTYGGYFLGRLAALKLRDDYAAARGEAFSLREFHAAVMTDGIAPWSAHRQLLLPGDTGPVLE
jgi:uncharacterized protein (DUF885 family)